MLDVTMVDCHFLVLPRKSFTFSCSDRSSLQQYQQCPGLKHVTTHGAQGSRHAAPVHTHSHTHMHMHTRPMLLPPVQAVKAIDLDVSTD